MIKSEEEMSVIIQFQSTFCPVHSPKFCFVYVERVFSYLERST